MEELHEVFEVRDTPEIGSAILTQIVKENDHLESLVRCKENLLNSDLLLDLSQFFYSNAIFDV